jgi:hypothetical protein
MLERLSLFDNPKITACTIDIMIYLIENPFLLSANVSELRVAPSAGTQLQVSTRGGHG